jgi:hypothetical protein
MVSVKTEELRAKTGRTAAALAKCFLDSPDTSRLYDEFGKAVEAYQMHLWSFSYEVLTDQEVTDLELMCAAQLRLAEIFSCSTIQGEPQ